MMFSIDTLEQYRREVREMRERKADGPLEDTNQQSLVEAYLPFVIRIARAYEYTGVELLDLIQEGNLGLIVAAKKFDPSRETKFSTYAVHWIKQAITTALSSQSTSLSSSRYKYQRLQFLIPIRNLWYNEERKTEIKGESPMSRVTKAVEHLSIEEVKHRMQSDSRPFYRQRWLI